MHKLAMFSDSRLTRKVRGQNAKYFVSEAQTGTYGFLEVVIHLRCLYRVHDVKCQCRYVLGTKSMQQFAIKQLRGEVFLLTRFSKEGEHRAKNLLHSSAGR